MNEISGLPMVAKLSEQLNRYFKMNEQEKFTKTLKKLYEPLKSPETASRFLSEQALREENTAECMVLNVYNRFLILNTLLSLFPEDLFKAFLGNNDFRTQLIAKGAKVKIVNGQLISYTYKEYTFPKNETDEGEIDPDDFICLGKASDATAKEGQTVLTWPGCSVVMPKKYKMFTIANPEIAFPAVTIRNKETNRTISFYETNWGVNISQSDNGLISVAVDGEAPQKEEALQKSYSNAMQKNVSDFFSISVFVDNYLLKEEGSELLLELPLSTPRQDILMKITDEDQTETPIFVTMTT